MAKVRADYNNIPKEKFQFVNTGGKLSDKKFDDKPIGYFKDAWIRFKKSRASVVAAVIILAIVLYAFLTPLLITSHDAKFMCSTYQKKPARIASIANLNLGIFDGAIDVTPQEATLINYLAIGMAAEDYDGHGVTLEEGMESYYQPVIDIKDSYVQEMPGNKSATYYPSEIDTYLQVGFLYTTVEQAEYQRIVEWQEETGKQVIYPLIENNEWNPDPTNANFWYKAKARGNTPVRITETGTAREIAYEPGMTLEDNYKRDKDGNVVYYQYAGGGNFETAQFKIRILYYNYYQYLYGSEPDYLLGTDSQGYDFALRIAGGLKLSLLFAISVSFINFVIGAIYGAIEGYYGGTVDIVLERVSDILSGVPFIVVATLFQIHLATKVGAIPSLLFAYVMTGWIGTAYRVRSQFYRFKNSEYVMAARTLGARDRRIIWKHIFPNSLGTLITSSVLVIPSTILGESNLSYLGIVKLGTAEGTSLGTLLSDASAIWTNYPHLMIYPALFISLLMICFNLFGNGLRDAFNPALRGVEE